ncbi:hypothetical protein BD560DRAFT_390058 [Blakeslea trispora]|nr:hypothetical protein BD560DRAFT_390058 [Blakeslea trispora]
MLSPNIIVCNIRAGRKRCIQGLSWLISAITTCVYRKNYTFVCVCIYSMSDISSSFASTKAYDSVSG